MLKRIYIAPGHSKVDPGAAATATETLTNVNGTLTFTTDTAAVKLAMIVEYNFNHMTKL